MPGACAVSVAPGGVNMLPSWDSLSVVLLDGGVVSVLLSGGMGGEADAEGETAVRMLDVVVEAEGEMFELEGEDADVLLV